MSEERETERSSAFLHIRFQSWVKRRIVLVHDTDMDL